jgi:hypothetical protein
LLVLGFALLLPGNRIALSTFDEGFTLTGPMIILQGGLPLRDFFSNYGPAQFYLNAAAFWLFGEQVMVGRVIHVAVLSLLGLVIAAMARQLSGGSRLAALWAWAAYLALCLIVMPTTNYSAHPACALLIAAGLVLGRADAARLTTAFTQASLVVGLAGLFRWDFGLFGAGALGVCALLSARAYEGDMQRQLRLLGAAALPMLGLWLLVYVPLLVVWGEAGRWFREVPLFSLLEFKHWRSLEFVGPATASFMAVWGELNDPVAMGHTFFLVAFAFVPVPIALTALVLMGRQVTRQSATTPPTARMLQAIFLCLVVFLLFNQMRVRPTLWQGFPAAAACIPLFALLFSELGRLAAPSARLARIGMTVAVLAISLSLASTALDTTRSLLGQPLVAAPMDKAKGILLPANQITYSEVVNVIGRNTRPGERIYSGANRHDFLWLNDVTVYFLSDRRPADRFMELEPGISNTRPAQQEIIESLKTHQVRLLVLSETFSFENNRTSQSNEVRDLDQYIAANYRVIKRIAPYRILLRNDATPAPEDAQP